MKLELQVEIIGDNSVAWGKRSGTIEGEDAEAIMDGLINPDPNAISFSFPKPNGEVVFISRQLMDSAIISVNEIAD